MMTAFKEVTGAEPLPKDVERPALDEPCCDPSGATNFHYLRRLHETSILHRFQEGYFLHQATRGRQNTEGSRDTRGIK